MSVMYSVVKKVWDYFYGSKDTLDSIAETSEPEVQQEFKVGFFRKIGRISFLNKDYGLIDDTLFFYNRVAQTSHSLSVGDTVSFLSCKTEKDKSERVVKVEPVIDLNSVIKISEENCLELRSVPRASLEIAKILVTNRCTRIVNGEVSKRIGRRLFILPLDIFCDVDKVQCDFRPIEGDSISAKVQFLDNPFEGTQEYQVTKLEPVLVKYGTGSITLAKDNGEGAIDNEIFFTNDVYPADFKPNIGGKVKYSSIESSQGRYKWRALSLEAEPQDKENEYSKKVVARFKNGIMIRGIFNFGPLHLEETEQLTVEMRNNGKMDRTLSHCSFTSTVCSSQVNLLQPDNYENLVFKPGQNKKFTFHCKAKFLGMSSEVFEFYFKGFKIDVVFNINVTLTNEVQSMLPEENKKIIHPKKNTYLYKNFDFSDAFFGMKTAPRTRYMVPGSVNKQASYPVPEDLFKIVLGDPEWCQTRKHNHIVDTVLRHYPFLGEELNMNNYRDRFHALLYFEEIEDRIMYRKYDLHNVALKKKENYLALPIPRLVGDKIVLGVGTQVILTQPWSETNTGKQVGFIHDYRDNELLISFHESFARSYDETECDIMFQPSRTTYVRSHNAVDVAVNILNSSWLFPKEVKESAPAVVLNDGVDDIYEQVCIENRRPLSLSEFDCKIDDEGFAIGTDGSKPIINSKLDESIKWFNKELNVHQKAAVKNVLEGKGRSIPYIIQGPPGTGKTVTVIELVLQLYHLISKSRIIVATPSNSAADLVCQKLIQAGNFIPGQVIRLLSFGRLMAGNFPEEIGPFCSSTQEDVQKLIPKGGQNYRYLSMNEYLGSERIVIGTCCTLSVLHDFGLDQGHFTHVILDEAAQCTEPESLIPINFIDPSKGQVILTGDTEQLGPISINFLSIRFGFSVSLMERIHNRAPYLKNKEKFPKTDGYDPRCVTKLKYNYRSVPGILRLPNRLFYDSELIPVLSGDLGKISDIISQFSRNIGLHCESSCVVFHGLRSINCQEENNFSWYNPHELWQIVCYLKKLYALELTPDDVGVITPYQKQVEKMRHMLQCLQIPMPKIGSVEEFQGQERLVVLLSTVRSDIQTGKPRSTESLIGFLSSPRRLNVAITRARALLIIVGNPYTLGIDRYWLEVIKYCVRNSNYIGCPVNQLLGM